ncbi:MAG TPA: hypothetical protein VHB79_31815 [Polyangiaceae bacterium]|nr:hypothetical protein [Polyangiaceae bacterium]
MVGILIGCAFMSGCALWGEPLPDPECRSLAIDSSSELLLSDDWLRGDERAKNAGSGTFSFAGQLQALRADHADFDAEALWQLVGQAEPVAAADLPFRLLALVNRTDLAEQLAPDTPAGEARLVYTLTTGAGDASAARARPFTVIFEYSLGSAGSPRDWAARFHELAALPTEARGAAAAKLVESFTAPPATAEAPHLSQIRVNDARSGTSRLYELALDGGRLARRGLRNTPRLEFASTAELSRFAHDNADAIRHGTHLVPNDWLADMAPVAAVDWLPSEAELAHAFSRGTCSGCHGDDGPAQNGFHVSEAADGSVTPSSFLIDEELPRRVGVMRARLCGVEN